MGWYSLYLIGKIEDRISVLENNMYKLQKQMDQLIQWAEYIEYKKGKLE